LPVAPAPGKTEDSARSSQATAGTAAGRTGETPMPPTPATAAAGGLAADEKAATIENTFFRVRLDPARGGVASIVEKRTGREMVDSSEYALGQYVWERFDANQVAAYVRSYCKISGDWVQRDYGKPELPPAKDAPGSTVSPKNAVLELSQGPVYVAATLGTKATGDLPHEVALRVMLYRDQPWVDLAWSIKDKPATPWPEAGWLALPLKIDHPAFRLGRTGSIVDPAKDVIRAASHVSFCLNTGLTATDADGAGVGLCPVDSPIVSIERRGIYQFSKDFLATKPLVWVNLYNNAFSVNFQQWIGGSWSSRVRLWSVPAGAGAAEALIAPGWQARQPCRVAVAAGAAGPASQPAVAGKLPPSRAGIELSRGGVLVTAFGPNIDGAGTILRLWEQSGSDQPCRVKLPDGLRPAKAQPVDLRGRPVGPAIPVQAGELTVPLTHFAPVSLLLGE
jgi:alpha-mannosidase